MRCWYPNRSGFGIPQQTGVRANFHPREAPFCSLPLGLGLRAVSVAGKTGGRFQIQSTVGENYASARQTPVWALSAPSYPKFVGTCHTRNEGHLSEGWKGLL